MNNGPATSCIHAIQGHAAHLHCHVQPLVCVKGCGLLLSCYRVDRGIQHQAIRLVASDDPRGRQQLPAHPTTAKNPESSFAGFWCRTHPSAPYAFAAASSFVCKENYLCSIWSRKARTVQTSGLESSRIQMAGDAKRIDISCMPSISHLTCAERSGNLSSRRCYPQPGLLVPTSAGAPWFQSLIQGRPHRRVCGAVDLRPPSTRSTLSGNKLGGGCP